MGHTSKTPLSWVEEGIDLKMFWDGGRGGVPLIYDVTNKKINCNRKQLKEMKLKKRKCKSERNRQQLRSKSLNRDALLLQWMIKYKRNNYEWEWHTSGKLPVRLIFLWFQAGTYGCFIMFYFERSIKVWPVYPFVIM